MDSIAISDNSGASERERRAFRARFVAAYLFSYTIDTVLLGLFAAAGTIAFWIPIAYFTTGAAISAVFGSIMLFGISERFRDPYITTSQTFVSGTCMLVFLALAPEVGFLFLCTLFIVFGFSSLRLSWREALQLFGLIALGTGAVLYHTSGIALSPHSTPAERLLVWMAFVAILARLIVLGLVGSGFRIRVVKAYLNLKALTSELETRTSELGKAKAAAEAANLATLESERKLAEQALRKRADDALRQSEERYRVLAEASNDIIALVNGRHEVEYANTFAARLFGCSAQELIGKRLAEIFSPETAARQELNLRKVFDSGESLYVEAPFTFLGNSLWLGSSLVPVKDSSGASTSVLVVSRDITERKQVERKLLDSLAEKEVLMREIHHRVKNNLQMMSALLELQSGKVTDGQALAYFQESQQRIQSMAMIHAQLYQNQDLARIAFDAYLQDLVEHLRGQYSERCARVAIRVDAEACAVPVDTAVPLGLAVNELVSNAMKHAFPGGRTGALRIGLRRGDEGGVVLEVADDGVGLPAGLDLHGSQSFGLQLLRLMVEQQLHGKLTVHSNHGTRVVCEIGMQK